MSDSDEMDVPAVLKKLNAALVLQRRSAMQYLYASGSTKGPAALGLSELLWDFAQADFAGVRDLVIKIAALGGTPDSRQAELPHHSDLDRALRHLIDAENEALAALHAVIPDTGQQPHSEALEHLVEHLIMRKQTQVDCLMRAA